MPIGVKFLPVLTAQERQYVEQSIDRLTVARDQLALAADCLAVVKPLGAEADKLVRSGQGLEWERRLVEDRLQSLLEQGKRIGGCTKCGCRLVDGRCAACSTGSPSDV